MLIKNAKRWAPGGAKGYGVAVAAFLFAFFVRYAAQNVLDDGIPFLGFLVVALLVQYRYGLGPAILIAVLAIPTGFYYFVKPFNAFAISDTHISDILLTIGYLIAFAVGIGLIELLQRSRYEARLLADVARSRYEVLLRSESERQSAVATARASREHFRTFSAMVGDVLYMKRLGGGFEYVNELLATRSGRAVDDLMGGKWTSIMHPEDAGLIEEQIAAVGASRQSSLSEFRLRVVGGGYAVFEGNISAMEDERGVVVRWTGAEQAVSAFSIASNGRS